MILYVPSCPGNLHRKWLTVLSNETLTDFIKTRVFLRKGFAASVALLDYDEVSAHFILPV